ncbi:alpha/beta hydrolase [Paenibacillus sp. FSL K6-1217]|uniref:alpha/beta fold hydrolase n=1 Tax=Paenibacillus sp. FSL K6-1217 TaxID=2921466 RepID=UPI00324EE360
MEILFAANGAGLDQIPGSHGGATGQYNLPALLISGEHDPFAGEDRTAKLASLLTNARTLIVQGAGHRPHMLREQSILVNDTILEFLAQNPIH